MCKVIIYGAGSIGNHLAYACRNKEWEVIMADINSDALKRTREDIYPSRYGKWDPGIKLKSIDEVSNERCDVVIIGTPPDTHVRIATQVLENSSPKILLIEKPLCTPLLAGVQKLVNLQKAIGTFVAVGYNHTLTENSRRAAQILKQNSLGTPITINACFREHWGGIFTAHPWLNGPRDSYLGFSERGGGASGEHSHAINIWQHFAHLVGAGRIVEVSATMDFVDDGVVKYDRVCLINVRTENGLVGNIAQDVVTGPSQKELRIQGTKGFLEWFVNFKDGYDAIHYWDGSGEVRKELIQKTRPDDFKGEIDHIEQILKVRERGDSPISIERGLDTMMVIAAAHMSCHSKRAVRINYNQGYTPDSLELL
jgi:predicted dehydrogenase